MDASTVTDASLSENVSLNKNKKKVTKSKYFIPGIVILSIVVIAALIFVIIYFTKPSKYEYDPTTNTCSKSKSKYAIKDKDCQLLVSKSNNNTTDTTDTTEWYACNTTSGSCILATAATGQSKTNCTNSCKKEVVTAKNYGCDVATYKCIEVAQTGTEPVSQSQCAKQCQENAATPATVTYACDKSNRQCVGVSLSDGQKEVNEQTCKDNCNCNANYGGPRCEKYTMSLPSTVDQKFPMTGISLKSRVEAARSLYTMGAFTVPKNVFKINVDIGMKINVGDGSGYDTLNSAFVLIKRSVASDQIPNLGTVKSFTATESSDAVKDLLNDTSNYRYLGGSPGWSSRNQVVVKTANGELDVDASATYYVAVYLGIATNDTITMKFAEYTNTITFV
jgi:hypothetical protein